LVQYRTTAGILDEVVNFVASKGSNRGAIDDSLRRAFLCEISGSDGEYKNGCFWLFLCVVCWKFTDVSEDLVASIYHSSL
jgi:hypothetical protein